MAVEGGKDSFDVVKEYLGGLGDAKPGVEDALRIRGALVDIHERLMRVRKIAPSVDLSERMWELMALVGLKVAPVGAPAAVRPFRSAATFL
jgi:hypothetical protein